jgi:S1-C subfamily serine protease
MRILASVFIVLSAAFANASNAGEPISVEECLAVAQRYDSCVMTVLAERGADVVFPIHVWKYDEDQNLVTAGTGSGILRTGKGGTFLSTSAHVIPESDPSEYRVFMYEHIGELLTPHEVSLVGVDRFGDVALLTAPSDVEFPYMLPTGDCGGIEVGMRMYKIGYGLGRMSPSINEGYINSLEAPGAGAWPPWYLFSHSASMNPGDSGGANVCIDPGTQLVNVFGINTSILAGAANLGVGNFSIPMQFADEVLERLRLEPTFEHATLSASVIDVNQLPVPVREHESVSAHQGAYVVRRLPNGPAAQAGLAESDVITGIELPNWDEIIQVPDARSLEELIFLRLTPRDEVILHVESAGAQKILQVRLGNALHEEQSVVPGETRGWQSR